MYVSKLFFLFFFIFFYFFLGGGGGLSLFVLTGNCIFLCFYFKYVKEGRSEIKETERDWLRENERERNLQRDIGRKDKQT